MSAQRNRHPLVGLRLSLCSLLCGLLLASACSPSAPPPQRPIAGAEPSVPAEQREPAAAQVSAPPATEEPPVEEPPKPNLPTPQEWLDLENTFEWAGERSCSRALKSGVPACSGRLCVHEKLRLVATSWDTNSSFECFLQDGETACGNDGQYVTLETPDLYIQFRLKTDTFPTQDDELAASLDYINSRVVFAKKPRNIEAHTMALRQEKGQLASVQARSGVLRVEFKAPQDSGPSFKIHSKHRKCRSGDIGGRCYCHFDSKPVDVTVVALIRASDLKLVRAPHLTP